MNATRPLMFWIVTLALVAVVVVLLRQVLLPFVAGMALAYLLDPLANRLERIGMNRAAATLFILGLFILGVITLLMIAVPIWSGDCHTYRKPSRLHQTRARPGSGSEPSVAKQDHWCGTDRSPTFEQRASEHGRQLAQGPLALTVVGRSGIDFDLLALAGDTDRHRIFGL